VEVREAILAIAAIRRQEQVAVMAARENQEREARHKERLTQLRAAGGAR